MKTHTHCIAAARKGAGLVLVALLSLAALADRFEAGFARVDITPPLGVPLSGYFGYRPAEKILDPLEATCVAFSDGVKTALVYTVDNLHVSDDVIARAWTAIARATGVTRDTVFIASTHTHTGPATEKRYYLRGLSAEAEAEAGALADVEAAHGDGGDVVIELGTGQCEVEIDGLFEVCELCFGSKRGAHEGCQNT